MENGKTLRPQDNRPQDSRTCGQWSVVTSFSILHFPFSIFLLCCLLPTAVHAQVGGAWVNVTRVESKQMKNAVSLTIEADGTLQFYPWFSPDPDVPSLQDQLFERKGTRWERREVTALRLRIPNARTQVGSFVDVSKYPIDHVELSIPPKAQLGVGLDITIIFYAPVVIGGVNVGGEDDRWREPDDERRRLLYLIMPPDQRSLKIIVTSERLGEDDGDKPATRWTPGRRELSVDDADGRLSIHALHADMRALLNAIAEKTGTSIRVDDTLDRLASLHLPEVTVEGALRAIAATYGLSLQREDGTFMVSEGIPRRASPYQLSETRLFPLKYISAVTARDLLPLFLLRYAHVDTEQNALSVAAPAALLDKVASDLATLDTPTPQLVIEAVLVEFFSTKAMEAFLNTTFRDRSIADPTLSPTGYGVNAALGQLFFRKLGALPSDFGASLRALVAEERGRLRAQPKAVVRNGQTARLFVGRTQYIQIQVPARFGPRGVEAEALGVDLGVKFEVTPWTGGGGMIHLQGIVEVSNLITQDPITRLPDLATRRAETSIRVKDDETIVIGGLIQKQDQRRRRRVPILGDIPIIGSLFQSLERHTVDTELVLFITPRLLTPEGRLPDAEKEKEMREKFLPEGKK